MEFESLVIHQDSLPRGACQIWWTWTSWLFIYIMYIYIYIHTVYTLVFQIPYERGVGVEKAFRGSKDLLKRYLEDFGKLGYMYIYIYIYILWLYISHEIPPENTQPKYVNSCHVPVMWGVIQHHQYLELEKIGVDRGCGLSLNDLNITWDSFCWLIRKKWTWSWFSGW